MPHCDFFPLRTPIFLEMHSITAFKHYGSFPVHFLFHFRFMSLSGSLPCLLNRKKWNFKTLCSIVSFFHYILRSSWRCIASQHLNITVHFQFTSGFTSGSCPCLVHFHVYYTEKNRILRYCVVLWDFSITYSDLLGDT